MTRSPFALVLSVLIRVLPAGPPPFIPGGKTPTEHFDRSVVLLSYQRTSP